MDRTPPLSVRRKLRAEVGQGCPIDGCRSPYLSWHHFDPPWSVREHHNPEGMIALCKPHHDAADGGAYSVEQLRRLKTSTPSFTHVGGTSPWRRENTLVLVGGNHVVDQRVIIRVRGYNILWTTKDDDGNDMINLEIRGKSGAHLFKMQDNDWLATPPASEVIAPVQRRSLTIKSVSENASLDIQFSTESADVARGRILSAAGILAANLDNILTGGNYFSAGEALLCEISCEIVWPYPVSVTDRRLLVDATEVAGNILIGNSGAAINVE